MLPIQYPREIRSSFKLIESIVYPKGSIKILSLKHENEAEKKRLQDFLPLVEKKFKEIKIPISKTSIDNKNFNDATNISMQALNAAFFKPNTVLITIDPNLINFSQYEQLIKDVRSNKYGLIFYIPYGTASLAIQKNISLWIHQLPENWDTLFDLGINDLAILTAIQISKNWKGIININFVKKSNLKTDYKNIFKEMVRFPKETSCNILDVELIKAIEQETNSDLNVLSISTDLTIENMVEMVKSSRISAIFCLDSGNENALV
jgi:hypothetical protein